MSSYGVYLNFAANTVRDVSITNSDFDLRADGDSDLRSYGVVFDSYGAGSGSLNVSGNTFNNSTWGLGVFDFAGALSGAPDYSGITGNTFTNTNEAAGNIRNGTDYVITTGSNVSNGVTYDRFLVGTGDSLSSASGDDVLTGNDGNELIAGNAGNDQITGGRGNDKIYGGDGNDTANVDVSTDGADNVDLGSGLDTVNAGGAAQIRVTFTSAEVGNGNVNDGGVVANNQDGGLAVRLQAENGSDGLTGPVGRYDDEGITFLAANGSKFDVRDLVSGTQRGDQFDAVALGTLGDDVSTFAGILNYYANGGAGNDTITTGAGNDFLVGGIGNDTLTGGSGDDSFLGGAGTDTILGGIGNDILDGGAGADTLTGGTGNDSYVVDDTGDVVTEAANGGTDTVTVQTLTSYQLGANVEKLVYNGTANFTATGNNLANEITTGSGNDFLNGSTGNDVMNGGAGNDIYNIQGADTVIDASGTDEVRSSVQSLSLLSYNGIENARLVGTRDLNLTGNQGNNTLIGNDGANVITGGLGLDTMTGGAGADVFDFNSISESGNTTATADFIRDFVQSTDTTTGDLIDLFTIDARTEGPNAAGNNAFAFIGTAAFTGAGQLRYQQSGGSTYISGNVNNDLGADFMIRLNGNVTVSDADFVL